ncbi:MAG: hypothetical protein ABI156_06110 [Caldimonas sp.]
MRTALAEAPQRWTWQRDAGPPAPVTASLQRWLARLDAAIAEPGPQAASTIAPRDPNPSSADDTIATLRLLRDGRLHTMLRLGSAGVQGETVANPAGNWRRALSSSAVAELKTEMPQPDR